MTAQSDIPSAEDQDESDQALILESETTTKPNNPRDKPDFDDFEWAATSRSAFVKPEKNLPNLRERQKSLHEHHKSVFAQIRNNRYHEYIQAQPVDWRKIHNRLFRQTKVQPKEDWIENGLKITLPCSLARQMLQDAGDFTIGAIRRRTKTTIAIPSHDPAHTTRPSLDDASVQSTLIVSGARKSMNKVVDEVRRAAGQITISPLYLPLRSEETEVEMSESITYKTLTEAESKNFTKALKRFKLLSTPLTRAEGAHNNKRWIDHHVKMTSMPSTWTIATFEEYVEELVDSTVEGHLHSQIYVAKKRRPLEDHEKAVTNRLCQLFNSAPAALVASCSALKIALNYICARGPKHFPAALRLVRILELRGLRLDTQAFNMLVKATVKMADANRFFVLLKRMKWHNYKPDLETWLLFLRMTKSPQHRLMILQSIRSKNLLVTQQDLRSVAKEMAADDAERAISEGKDLKSFLEEQERRYGPMWLTPAAAHHAIDVFCSHQRFDDAFKMLDLMMEVSSSLPPSRYHEKPDMTPTGTSFVVILSHARLINKVPLAVNAQRKLAQSNARHKYLDFRVLDLLFKIAWKSNLRSSLVVIWRYASLARMTTWHMRQRVADLLQGKVDNGGVGLSESAYRALGGETLARELAGGREALARIRSLAEIMPEGRTKSQARYRERLGALAARVIPLAFSDLSPAVEPGEVLTQSVLADWRCLRARKQGKLEEVLSTATVKTIPLVKDDRRPRGVWVGFGPRSGVRVSTIEGREPLRVSRDVGPADVWEDRWESKGWKLQDDRTQKDDESIGIPMAIITPRVWVDDDEASLGQTNRTQIQTHNEEMILKALSRLESRRTKHQRKESTRRNVNVIRATTEELEGADDRLEGELEESQDVSDLWLEAEEDTKWTEEFTRDNPSTKTVPTGGGWLGTKLSALKEKILP